MKRIEWYRKEEERDEQGNVKSFILSNPFFFRCADILCRMLLYCERLYSQLADNAIV